jgi:hypothetical protein
MDNEARRGGTIRRVKPDRRHNDRRDPEERRRLPEDRSVRKILITGDRNWSDVQSIVEALKVYRPGTILVHGACKGADNTCAVVAETLGFIVRGYPADWSKHGRAAGPIRNQLMIDTENRQDEPLDECLVFHDNLESSKGTADMVRRVIVACIPYVVHHSTSTGA